MLWVVLLYLLYGYVSLFLHELAHASIVLISRHGHIVDFKPYPHTYKGVPYVGRVSFRYLTLFEARLCYLAPLVKGVLLSVLFLWLSITVTPIFTGFLVWEVLDAVWWVRGWAKKIPGTDGCRYRALGMKR